MKEIRYRKPGHDLSKLLDELFLAIPSLRPALDIQGRPDPSGQIALNSTIHLHGSGDEILASMPDDTDGTVLEVVISEHVG